MRSTGYGRKALKLLCKLEKTAILESDTPVDELSIRRKAFYERAVYTVNAYTYVYPPYRTEYQGHPLVVMSYLRKLEQQEYKCFTEYIKGIANN